MLTMEKVSNRLVLILSIIIVFESFILGRIGFVLGCLEHEREALLKFKGSVIRDISAHRLSSWTGKDCCYWKGVSCNINSNHVYSLNLRTDFYISDLPLYFQYLDSSLLELKELRNLDLSGNDFNYNSIPKFIGSMKFLRYLNLTGASFGGIIPPHLGNLTRLQHLDLSGNQMLKVTNLDWISSLVNLKSLDMSSINLYNTEAQSSLQALNTLSSLLDLRLSASGIENSLLHLIFQNANFTSIIHRLDLSYNSFEDIVPFFLVNMTSLTHLDLSNNLFYLENYSQPSLIPYNSSLPLGIKHLDLSRNFLEGQFPYFLYNLSSLRYLDLSSNELNGSIPLYLRNNQEFVFLDLSHNSFSQVEGGTIVGILGNLCKLKYFSLSNNFLVGGEILDPYDENFSECVSFDLEHFDLSYNNIVSTMPFWLVKFRNLRVLSLYGGVNPLNYRPGVTGGNQFHSPLPTYIGNLSLLEELDLGSCGLKGRIPSSFGNLALLQTLDLSSNLLEGSVSFIANLTSIKYLYLSYNQLNLNFSLKKSSPKFQLIDFEMRSCKIEGSFSQWLKTQHELQFLDLSNNAINDELMNWSPNDNLRLLNLSNNYIVGKIPDFSLSSQIDAIDLSNNSFSGPLITSLCNLKSLSLLNLKQNQLSGLIPDCWSQESLIFILDLSFNKLSGTIPVSLGQLPLEYLKLNNNFIEGKIPSTMNVISKMIILDLGENKLTGKIPKWDGESCSNLYIVRLRKNNLEGSIPSQFCSLPNLQILDLSNNNLTGSIPRCFDHLSHMKPTQAPPTEFYEDTIPPYGTTQQENAMLVLKGEELQYTTNLIYVVDLDLSCNGLEGSIPEELTNLSALIGLNLSHNHLTGNIPIKIGDMRALESLDLSNNNLSGRIPSSLGAITSLSTLNLSCNKLHGEIPTGSQLQTLNDPSIYGNNAGLCGDPLPSCETKHGKQKQEEDEDEDDGEDNRKKVLFSLDVMLGLATGFWGVVGTLLINKKRRHAFFERVDDFGDYLYVLVVLRIKRFRN